MLNEILSVLEHRGISKAKLSKITGIEKRTIYHVLQNEENFQNSSYKIVSKIQQVLNVCCGPAIVVGDKIYRFKNETFNTVVQILGALAD